MGGASKVVVAGWQRWWCCRPGCGAGRGCVCSGGRGCVCVKGEMRGGGRRTRHRSRGTGLLRARLQVQGAGNGLAQCARGGVLPWSGAAGPERLAHGGLLCSIFFLFLVHPLAALFDLPLFTCAACALLLCISFSTLTRKRENDKKKEKKKNRGRKNGGQRKEWAGRRARVEPVPPPSSPSQELPPPAHYKAVAEANERGRRGVGAHATQQPPNGVVVGGDEGCEDVLPRRLWRCRQGRRRRRRQ